MNDQNFSVEINPSNNIYFEDGIREWQSFDGQIYINCTSCKRVMWCEPYLLKQYKKNNIVFQKCDECQNEEFELVKFRHVLHVDCGSCYNDMMFDSRNPRECNNCGSTNFIMKFVEETPKFPKSFGTAFNRRDTDWCVSVSKDLNYIQELISSFRSTPDYYSLCLHLKLFLHFLYENGEYQGDEKSKSELINFPALLLRQLYRELGDINIGIESIKLIEKAIGDVSSDSPYNKALYLHNAAMIIYSILAKRAEETANIITRRNLRSDATDYAKNALEYYSIASISDKLKNVKCAEVEWLIGDIIGSNIHVNNEEAKKKLNTAIDWYDKALKRPYIPSQTKMYIKESKESKLKKLGRRTAVLDEIEQKELLIGNDLTQTIQNYEDFAKQKFLLGQDKEGFKYLLKAYALIRTTLGTSSKDVVIKNFGTSINNFISTFVKNLVERDKNLLAALALMEDFREFAIWDFEMESMVKKKSAKIGLQAGMQKLLGGDNFVDFGYEDLKQITLDYVEKLKQEKNDLPEGIRLNIELLRGEFLVFITDFSKGKSSRFSLSKKIPDIQFHSFKLDEQEIETIGKILLLLQLDDVPSKMREIRIEKLNKIIIPKIKRVFSRSLANRNTKITLITGLWIIPFETVFNDFELDSRNVKVSYSPSSRVSFYTKRRLKNYSINKILLVGYGGSDLPYVDKEIELIADLLKGKDVDIVSGEDANKLNIVKAIKSSSYDLIHFACHGYFDMVNPLDSGLILHKSENQELRITAKDFESIGSFNSFPLIVLSACSSAVVRPNGSNNILGLTGTFIRMGVTGIIGSRWSVGDKFTYEFMEEFYLNLCRSNNPIESLNVANYNLAQNRSIDKQTSFIYIGG